jgi:hypothetical protein
MCRTKYFSPNDFNFSGNGTSLEKTISDFILIKSKKNPKHSFFDLINFRMSLLWSYLLNSLSIGMTENKLGSNANSKKYRPVAPYSSENSFSGGTGIKTGPHNCSPDARKSHYMQYYLIELTLHWYMMPSIFIYMNMNPCRHCCGQ